MSVSLQEALKQVELRAGRQAVLHPGQVYRCQINGLLVELRVSQADGAGPESLIPEEDIMLDAWTEFPDPPGGMIVKAELGDIGLPVIPNIPQKDE